MSFSNNVKNELAELFHKDCSKRQQSVFLCGVLYAVKNGTFSVENKQLSDFLKKNITVPFTVSVSQKSGSERTRFLFAENPSESAEIEEGTVIGSDEDAGMFLRGIFVVAGTVTDPEKQYHLELALDNEEKCVRILNLVSEHGMTIRMSSRRGKHFLYTKDSECIADFLTYIGAPIHSMEVMNAKIVKELRNNINRSVNCEDANIGKIVNAGEKQAEDIRLIESEKGLGALTEDLLKVALIRLENTDISLREIGEMLEPKISRSGVFHRMQRIAEIADRLRGE